MDQVDNSLGEAIRRARVRHELTQTQVAARAGFSQGQISAWETGRLHPNDEQLAALRLVVGRIRRSSRAPSSVHVAPSVADSADSDQPMRRSRHDARRRAAVQGTAEMSVAGGRSSTNGGAAWNATPSDLPLTDLPVTPSTLPTRRGSPVTSVASGGERINNHAGFIWSVADLLRGDYKQSEYGKVILPLDRSPAHGLRPRADQGSGRVQG